MSNEPKPYEGEPDYGSAQAAPAGTQDDLSGE